MDRDAFWHSEAHLLELLGQTLIVDAMLPQDLILAASGCALQCAIASQSQPATLPVACHAAYAAHDLRRCCANILQRLRQFIAVCVWLVLFQVQLASPSHADGKSGF